MAFNFATVNTVGLHQLRTRTVEGHNYVTLSLWDGIFAGFAILLAAFGFNVLGDCLHDQLDRDCAIEPLMLPFRCRCPILLAAVVFYEHHAGVRWR